MSVYIKGMEMPDKCGHCRFASAFDCGVTGNFISTHSIRQPDCPLVPVPEHGDLIDRNKIGLTDFEIVMCDGNYKVALQMLLSKIEMMPSVLDADKETEE